MVQVIQWRMGDFHEVGAQTPKVDVKRYYLANFSQRRHEIKSIWTPTWRGAHPWGPP